ncbi:MAG TPA: ribosome silencing factor [Gemmatimonadales bacterium]|nr:ribosome silencing factor [Gemmatimonadales bacterium]
MSRGRDLPDTVDLVVSSIEDAKGTKLLVLDLRGLSDAADFFVIASGTSDAHVRGIANRLVDTLHQEGLKVRHVEGLAAGRWVLLDVADIIVHLFHPETRAFYRLERLWQDAPMLLAHA